MVIRCAFCGKQIIDSHDCNERRAAQAQINALGAVPTVAESLFQPVELSDKDTAFAIAQAALEERRPKRTYEICTAFGIPADAVYPAANDRANVVDGEGDE